MDILILFWACAELQYQIHAARDYWCATH